MLSTQLLLVVFYLAYDRSSENSQVWRIEPLHYNKQYFIRHHRLSDLPNEKYSANKLPRSLYNKIIEDFVYLDTFNCILRVAFIVVHPPFNCGMMIPCRGSHSFLKLYYFLCYLLFSRTFSMSTFQCIR